jgi:Restriction alleviation protein Lar
MTPYVGACAAVAEIELQMFTFKTKDYMTTNDQLPTDAAIFGNANVLRSCPFCGCEAELKQYAHNGIQVKCKRCLMGLKQKTKHYSLDWLKQKMIDAWNARE